MGTVTVLTQTGENWVTSKLNEDRQETGDYVGWGTGAGTASKSDTGLFTPATEARVVATRSKPATDILQWLATIICAGANKTITEVANFTASTAGDIIIHASFDGIPLEIGDGIQFAIQLETT